MEQIGRIQTSDPQFIFGIVLDRWIDDVIRGTIATLNATTTKIVHVGFVIRIVDHLILHDTIYGR